MASSALASAAAGATNPFGLPIPRPGHPLIDNSGANGYELINPPQRSVQKTPTGSAPIIPVPTTPATTPGAAGAPTPTVNTTFNLQTDPALQQVNALAGLSDSQAQAQALKERQQQLLQYGDPTLAAAVLGQTDPTVQAAQQNQESQLAMLGRQRDQNLRAFDTQLDPSLVFSGYRVGQEHLLGQAYQDALAQAAAGVQGNLDSITGSLNSVLNQNQAQREAALSQAEQVQMQQILAGLGGGVAGGTGAGTDTSTTAGSGASAGVDSGSVVPPPVSGGNTPVAGSAPILTAPDYNSALALSAATHQPVAPLNDILGAVPLPTQTQTPLALNPSADQTAPTLLPAGGNTPVAGSAPIQTAPSVSAALAQAAATHTPVVPEAPVSYLGPAAAAPTTTPPPVFSAPPQQPAPAPAPAPDVNTLLQQLAAAARATGRAQAF